MSEHQRYSLRRFDAALTTGVVVSTSSACRSVPDARPPGQPVDLRGPGGIDSDDSPVPSRTVVEVGETSTFGRDPAPTDTLDPGWTVAGCTLGLVPGRAEIVCTCPPDVSGGFVEEAVS